MHTQLPVRVEREAILRMAEAYDCPQAIFAGWPEGEKYKTLDAMHHMFDEYEKEIFDGMRKSYAYLTKNGLARGRI